MNAPEDPLEPLPEPPPPLPEPPEPDPAPEPDPEPPSRPDGLDVTVTILEDVNGVYGFKAYGTTAEGKQAVRDALKLLVPDTCN